MSWLLAVRAREEEGRRRSQDQQNQLKNFAVDGCGAHSDVVGGVAWGGHLVLGNRTIELSA
jgi:hypothetical protein